MATLESMTVYDTDAKSAYTHFDSVEDWLKAASDSNSYEMYDDSGFTDGVSGIELSSRIRTNTADKSILSKVQKALAVSATDTHEHELPEYELYHDMSGITCDTTAYFMGEHECMINFDIQEKQKPIIYIACSFGAYASARADQFRNRGIALIRAAKHLQAQGVSVGIIGYSACTTNGYAPDGKSLDMHTQSVLVKRPQDELNETTLVNIFTMPAALRTIGFSVRDGAVTTSQGGTTTMRKAALAHTDFASERIVILEADARMVNFKTADSGIEHIKTQLETTTAQL